MLSAKLVVIGGDSKQKEVPLRLPTIIGRGREGVTLTIPHKLVSRQHTKIFEREGKLFVQDLGSLNGTFVNNQRIDGEQLLKPNELLTLGNVTFRAVYEDKVEAIAVTTEEATPPLEAIIEPELDGSSIDLAEESSEESGSSTDKSLIAALVDEDDIPVAVSEPSNVISGPKFDAIEGAKPEKSICLGALDGLPSANSEAVAENFNLAGVENRKVDDKIDLRLDDVPGQVHEDANDPKLGSFLKKLPR